MRDTLRRMTLVLAVAASACGGGTEETAPRSQAVSTALQARVDSGQPGAPGEPPMLGIHWARGQHAGGGSPDMTWHGGGVLASTAVTAIYWGTSWLDARFVGDKVSGLDAFYGGIGASSYAATTTEYGAGAEVVGTAISSGGHVVDGRAAPSHAPQTSTILAEVCARIAAPVPNGYYPVYVDTPRGHAAYCAWHSWGSCGGVPVQFAFFFDLDGDPGCDPQDTSGLHSQGLAALANVSGHELSETTTDPRGDAWFDSSGAENADKCAWTFGVPLVTFTDGTQWKIQGNWSNAAYDLNAGYPNSSGQDGCISGK